MLDLVEARGLHDLLQLVALLVPILCAEEQVLPLDPEVDESGDLWFRSVDLELIPGCLVGQGLLLHDRQGVLEVNMHSCGVSTKELWGR